jgi:hypothetical protein
VPHDIYTDVPKVCATRRSSDKSLDEPLGKRTAVIGTQQAAAFQVSMLPYALTSNIGGDENTQR